MAEKVYFRDTITLTQQLLSTLVAGTENPGDRIRIAARHLRVAENVTLEDRELYIVADTFDGSGGQILLTVPHAPQEPAIEAESGKTGRPVFVICRHLLGANIVSRGGNGQPGAKGADGHDGLDFIPPPPLLIQATAGEDGKRGARGGNGGAGGVVIVSAVGVADNAPPIHLLSQGGIGGEGGEGGEGGKGGCKNDTSDPTFPCTEHMPNGECGPKGADGVDGFSDSPPVLPAEENYYWLEARAVPGIPSGLVGIPDATWAKHRLKMAEYFFRQYIPGSPSKENGSLALGEVEAVIAMAAEGSEEAARATTLCDFLENNLSPTGMQRDIEPRLSVPYYEEMYDKARLRADNVIDRALLFGMTAVTADNIRSLIEGQLAEFQNEDTCAALEADFQDASTDQQIAQLSYEDASNTVTQLSDMIAQREEQLLDEGESTLIDVLAGPVASAALMVGLAAVTGGTGAAFAALPAAAGYILNSSEFQQYAGSLLDDLPLEQIESAAVTVNQVAAWGGADAPPIPSNAIMSFKKFRNELEQARGKSDPILLDLFQQKAAALHQQFLAELRSTQAGYAVTAAQKRIDALNTNIQNWTTILAAFDDQFSSLRRYTVALIERARGPFDTVLRLQYKMARALDLYTLSESSETAGLRFDYGFAHPDVERDFLEQTDDTTMVLEYLFNIATLSTALPGDHYLEQFTNYTELSTGPYQWHDKPVFDVNWSATSEAEREVLEHFKKTGRLDFTLSLGDVVKKEKDWYESKVRGVELIFTGGTYNEAFNPVFQHWGRSSQRRLPVPNQPAVDVEQELMPMFELVGVEPLVDKASIANGYIVGDKLAPVNFWGRGLAATYSLAIKKYGVPVIEEGPDIDLSGLSNLTVRFCVETFSSGLAAAQLETVSLPALALLPGGTTFGLLELSAPAPEGGAIVKFSSSNPAISIPQVKVAAGERSVKFPVTVAANAAGQKAVITASTSTTSRSLTVTIPNQKVRVLELVRAGAREGQYVHVRGLAADDRFVYAPYFLSPIDPDLSPVDEALSPDGKLTASAELGFLAVIDAATWTVKHRIPVGDQPVNVAVHNNALRRRLFVVNRGLQSSNLSVIDLSVDGKTFKSLPPVPMHAGIWDVAVHQASNRAYVTRWAGTLYVIDALATDPSKLLLETVTTGLGIWNMSVNQAANRIYLVRSVQDPSLGYVERIEVFDPVQRTFTPLGLPVGPPHSQPWDLTLDPDGRLYVSNLGNTPTGAVPPNVTVMDLTADDVMSVPTASGPWGIAVDPERNQVYVPTFPGLELVANSNHGGDPYRVALRVAMGQFPVSVAVHPVSGEIYVGDLRDGTVRAAPVVDASTIAEWL
jgi:DNA-binding beta-propeller fold protein YncE